MVARYGVYLFAGLTCAVLLAWALWFGHVWSENLPEDVPSFLAARRPVAAGVALLGVLPLACAVTGFAWGRSLRWWDYLIAGAAAVYGVAGALVIGLARLG